ncbi:MAG: dihydropteroate synthase [Pseudomonadales bacterium]
MLDLKFPAIMGILNVTPDSFSDGGKYLDTQSAIAHARTMIAEGADIIDIGGESTRPGAEPISPEEELDRVIPVIEGVRAFSTVPLSIDTSTPAVMAAAADAGANLINDVRSLRREGALAMAARTGLPVCLMHMQGDPRTMQMNPVYDDLIGEITAFFEERMEQCARAGIGEEKILLDPGFGFGKTVDHNLVLINQLHQFEPLGRPLLVGLSRKSTIGAIVSGISKDRLIGSVAGAVIAYMHGASLLRVHDVGATRQALAVAVAIGNARVESGNKGNK